jgi:hypothetical protein
VGGTSGGLSVIFPTQFGSGRHVAGVVGNIPDAVWVGTDSSFGGRRRVGRDTVDSVFSIFSVTRYLVQDTQTLGAKMAGAEKLGARTASSTIKGGGVDYKRRGLPLLIRSIIHSIFMLLSIRHIWGII